MKEVVRCVRGVDTLWSKICWWVGETCICTLVVEEKGTCMEEVEEMGTCREEEGTCTCKLGVEVMGICRAL